MQMILQWKLCQLFWIASFCSLRSYFSLHNHFLACFLNVSMWQNFLIFEITFLVLQNPFTFPSYHQRMLEPYDYYEFGQNYVRPLIDYRWAEMFWFTFGCFSFIFCLPYILPFFKGDLGRNVTPSKHQNCSAGCRNSYLGNIGLFDEIEGYLKRVRRWFPLSIGQL